MRKYLLIGFVMLAALAVMYGCDNRGTGAPTGSLEQWGLWPLGQHSVDSMFTFQLKNPKELLLGTTYIPKVAMPAPTGEGRPVPVLVLLAPEGGDQYFYWQHGLFRLVEDMLAKGEIQPMIIHTVGNDPVFGGYWYGNSFPAGRYDSIIGARLITFLNDRLVNTIHSQPTKRGIGGVGTGAYGAFRAALKHPGVFGSVAVADGPLDFDGSDGNSGLIPLFTQALAEQGLAGGTNATFKAQFDSSQVYPLSRILIGGAMAFSPHNPTLGYLRVPTNPDTGVVVTIIDSSTAETDTMTFITRVVTQESYWGDFHMPFDQTGTPYAPIWSKWLHNNLDSLYDQDGGTPLANTEVFVASSPSAPYNYYPMTQSWIATMRNKGVTVEEYNYDVYPNGPAGSEAYLYDVMRKILKFESDRFYGTGSSE